MPSKAQKRKRQAAKRHGTEAAKMRDGGNALFVVPEESREDTQLIQVAVKNRWPVTQTIAKKLVRRLVEVAEKKTVKIFAGEGVFDCESTADKNANAAAKTLLAMALMNQKDEIEEARRNGPQKPQPQTTINVGVKVDNHTDTGRTLASQVLQRIRNGVVSEGVSGGPAD